MQTALESVRPTIALSGILTVLTLAGVLVAVVLAWLALAFEVGRWLGRKTHDPCLGPDDDREVDE